MNWVDRILSSDAAKVNPDAARKIIEAAGGAPLLLASSPASGVGVSSTASLRPDQGSSQSEPYPSNSLVGEDI